MGEAVRQVSPISCPRLADLSERLSDFGIGQLFDAANRALFDPFKRLLSLDPRILNAAPVDHL
jgi:hypothetical protein